MKTRILLTLIIAALGLKSPAAETDPRGPSAVLPLISMEDVGLTDAVLNLARQAQVNYILDPAVLAPFMDSSGQPVRQPMVNGNWTNVTAGQVLDVVLKANKLNIVTNPVTTVARIAPSNQNTQPIPAGALGNDTGAAMPLISMDDVPLGDAIKNVARQAGIDVTLNPALMPTSPGSGRRPLAQNLVNVRWVKITAKQALVALLDNYNLVLQEASGGAPARIITKAQAEADAVKKSGQ